MYESRGICDHYRQKPGKALEVWLVHLGDERVELMMLVKGEVIARLSSVSAPPVVYHVCLRSTRRKQ